MAVAVPFIYCITIVVACFKHKLEFVIAIELLDSHSIIIYSQCIVHLLLIS